MRSFFAFVGMALIIIGCAVGVAELLGRLTYGGQETLSLGQIWYTIHGNSLVGLQAAIEKNVSPGLWPPVLSFLSLPAWLALPVPGILMVLFARGRRERSGFA